MKLKMAKTTATLLIAVFLVSAMAMIAPAIVPTVSAQRPNTYYVSTGNDANDGFSLGTAKLTIQAASATDSSAQKQMQLIDSSATLTALKNVASHVMSGTVISTECAKDKNGIIWTYVTMSIATVLKGPLKEGNIAQIKYVGGTVVDTLHD